MPLNSQSLDRILSAETTVSATITSNTAFTLPSAANMAGKLYTIYNPSASTANVLVNAADASLVVTVQPGSAAVVTPISDVPATNAAWMVVTNGVNASGVKGRTDGSAIAAGYVGEMTGTLQAGTNGNAYFYTSSTLSTVAGVTVLTQNLNKGLYLIGIQAQITTVGAETASVQLVVGGTGILTSKQQVTAAANITVGICVVPVLITADATAVSIKGTNTASTSNAQTNVLSVTRIA